MPISIRPLIRFACLNAALVVGGLLSATATAWPASPPLNKLQWRSVGPWIGGRVVAVAGVPGQPNLFYMGGVDSGVWKSTDYGLVWTNLTDGKLPGSSNSIGALAVAPSDPATIYAGTGEADIRGDMITGDGVYKSTDAGKTWQYAGLRDTHTTSGIVVDPRHANIVYASSMGHVFKPNAERGVFKSTDGGKSWRKILFVDNNTGAITVVMDPKNANVLYASMWQAYRTPWSLSSGGPGTGLYKTTDGGKHWVNLTRNPGFPRGILGRIGVAIAPSNPRVLYAIVQAKAGGVFRSADGGGTWTLVNNEGKLRQRAFYYMNIYADPKRADTVYAPQVDALWVSHNGGKVWTKLHTPHGDNHIVWINPQNTSILLEGNDGGATVSTDAGKTWSSEHNQPTGQFYHVGLDDRFPFHIYGAQQDEGSFEGPSASPAGAISGDEWQRVAYGESTFVAPEPENPSVAYGSGYFSILMRSDARTGEYRSVSPWPHYQEGASSNELKYRFGWTHPILFSPVNPKELLVGSQYVLRSLDEGRTWERISPDLTRNDPKTEAPSGGPVDIDQSSAEVYPDVSSLAVSPLDGNQIWAGSADGLVHITTNGGTSWQDVTPPSLPQTSYITSIEPSHVAAGTAYLTASRYMWDDFHPYIFKTTDYGRTWTWLTRGIPQDQYAFVIRQDPANANLLFTGTKNTVYTSLDGGANWQSLSLNLPHVQVRDLAINPPQGAVVVATHGRAFWILDNLALLEEASQGNAGASNIQLFAPQDAWLSYAYGSPDAARPGSGENPPFGATVFFNLPSSYNGSTHLRLSFSDAKGQVIRSFDLHLQKKRAKPAPGVLDQERPWETSARERRQLTGARPGMNKFQWDLRYDDATEVRNFWVPIAAGGLEDSVAGPTVLPGQYTVTLEYGTQRLQEPLVVKLDPRLHPAPDALSARLDLALRIHQALDALNRTINEAVTVRDRTKSPAKRSALDAAMAPLVQFDLNASEGPLMHETKLRDHLAYLASEVDLAYVKPTPAQYAVFEELSAKATAGEQMLRQAMANAQTNH